MEQFISAKFLSGRNTNQKIGIVGVTTGKVLEVLGRAGIGSTIFEPSVDLDVRGSASIRDNLNVGADLYVSDNLNVGNDVYINDNLYVSGVTTSLGGFVGNLTGIAASAIQLVTPRSFEITGDIVASPIFFDGTTNVSLAATIQPNSVELGTDTTGDYVQTVSGTVGQIKVTGGTGEGSTPVVGFDDNPTLPGNVTVSNDLIVIKDIFVGGNVNIGGTTSSLQFQDLRVKDKNLILGLTTNSSNQDVSSDVVSSGGGVSLASTEGYPLVNLYNPGAGSSVPNTYKSLLWFQAGSFAGLNTDAWLFNYAIGIGSTQFPSGTRLAVGTIKFTENDLYDVRHLNVSGVATFTNGPVLIGTATSTGTLNQDLQVTGNAYISGNLGIGTTNPTQQLDVLASAIIRSNLYVGNVSSSLEITNNGQDIIRPNGRILLRGGGGQSTRNSIELTNSNGIIIDGGSGETYGVELKGGGGNVKVTQGNLLIGSSSETGTSSQPLQVTGGAYISGTVGIGITVASQTGNSSKVHISGGNIKLDANQDLTWDGTYPSYVRGSSGSSGSITLNAGNSTPLVYSTNRIESNFNDLSSASGFDGKIDLGSSANRFRYIWSTGPTFIGAASSTGTASQRLQVTGGVYVSGNLGIGTTNPTSPLYVVGDSFVSGIITSSSQVRVGSLFNPTLISQGGISGVGQNMIVSAGQGGAASENSSNSQLVLRNNDGATLSAHISGSVGLELKGGDKYTSVTRGPLLVGTATSTGTTRQMFQVAGISSGAYIGGNTGIGTTNPTSTLHVVGNTLITGVSTFGSIKIESDTIQTTTSAFQIKNSSGVQIVVYTGSQFLFQNTPVRIVKNNLFVDNAFAPNSANPFTVSNSLTNTLSKVGVNTSTPTSEFHVVGNTLINGITTTSTLNIGVGGTVITTTSSGLVGIGTTNPTEKLHVQGNLSFNDNVSYGSSVITTSTVSQTGIHSVFSASTYRSVEYTIQAVQGTNFHTTKILVIHDGTSTYPSEYGTVFNNSTVASYDVDISGGNIRLLATPASASSTKYTITYIGIKI